MTGIRASPLSSAAILFILFLTAWEDGRSHTIPNRYPAMLLLTGLVSPLPALGQRLFTGGTVFLLLLLLAVLLETVTRRPSIGGGDIKLYSALGTALPLRDLLLIALISQLLAAGWLLYFAAKGQRDRTAPLGPFVLSAYSLILLREVLL